MQHRKSALHVETAQHDLRPKTVAEVLRRRAEQQPEKMACRFLLDSKEEPVSLSYGELDLRARAIGRSLIGLGLGRERALLLYPPGLDFIAGFFGCLYAGLVAVPAYPARNARGVPRLRAIAKDAQAKVALTTSPILSRNDRLFAQAPDLAALNWIATDEVESGMAGDWQPPLASGADLAFLQYTSGSTGDPKGVMLTHDNLLHNAGLVYNAFEHTHDDRYVSWLPTFHDMGFMVGVLQPIYAGIPVVLMSPASFLQRPIQWLQAISLYKGTTSGGPNFAYDLCVRKVSEQQLATLDLSSWTVAFNGAEPVRADTLDRFARTFERCGFRREAFYPCYGLAEATLAVSGGRKTEPPVVKTIQPRALQSGHAVESAGSDDDAKATVGCGAALGDQKVAIVNPETFITCSDGEVGEIWVSGPSIAQGYWQKSAETERIFHAFTADGREGPFLRTGDLGFVQGGELFVTGRIKDLIILRGVNHYPQDIELTAEGSHPALRPGCGAAFSIESHGEERLVLAYEVDDRKHFDPSEITGRIRQSVSESHELQVYAVVLVRAGTIPKTSSGKIRRDACRKQFLEGSLQEAHRSTLDDSYSQDVYSRSREESFIRKALLAIEPRNRLPVAESYILEQAARVLRLSPSRMLPEQPLTTLGLDSLMAMELKNQIEIELGVTVSASKLLAGLSARQLASLALDQFDAPVALPPPPDISDEAMEVEYPLSFTQKALWFFYQLAPESAAYNVAFAIRFNSPIDGAALGRAFQSLVDRHPSLRTTFATRDGQPVQRVQRRCQARIRDAHASALRLPDLHRAMTEESYKAFDLEQGPLYRASLFALSPEEHILLLAVHHIVIDGWSFWVMLDELVKLYKAETTGEKSLLTPPAFRYSDYVRWQYEMLEGEEGERLFEYWKRELSGDLPTLNLPTSRPRPPVQTYEGASYEFKIDDELARRLKHLAATVDATPYMVLLSVFQILLHRYTGQDDILVGSPISARSRADFADIVGCFFNAVVLRADFTFDLTFEQFLRQVREKVLGALEHQDYPSHLLAERLQPVRDKSRPPLFQATFILQKPQSQGQVPVTFTEAGLPVAGDGLALSLVPVERKHARMELELEMIEADRAIYAWLHYNKDLFDAVMIEQMARHFLVLLDGAARNPRQRLSNLPLLTQEEMEDLLAEQSCDPVAYDWSGVEELFLEQAQKMPEKVAAVYNDGSITFAELSEQSDQLANLIRRLTR